MEWFPAVFIPTLFISAVILIIVAYFAFRKRSNPGGLFLGLLLLGMAEWTLAYALEIVVEPLPVRIIWAKLEYLGIANCPLLILLFSIEFTQKVRIKK
ncbi:MAG: hypothetical protein JXA42_20265, partial [Anaerolineales bacterium]|nr:hypothetical protein [Anaerolineales bacterium]